MAACAPAWSDPAQSSCVPARMMVNASKVRCTRAHAKVREEKDGGIEELKGLACVPGSRASS